MQFEAALSQYASGADPRELAAQIVAAMTEEERLSCLDGDLPFWGGLEDIGSYGYHYRPFPAMSVPRLGIPGFSFSDGPRGVVVDHATAFPVTMARGASWDPKLEEEIGEAIGKEIRAVGANLYGGVCINLLRHPAWGRAQETYGEDPYHVGEMGAALTRGVQRHAMAVVKHFACNSMENTRFKVDVTVDEQALHEVFLPHFRRVVDEGVAVVMSAYNQVNGEWCGDHHELLTTILREEWGFEGFVISDWIFGMRDAATSVKAGLNVEMPYEMMRHSNLRAALEAKELSWDDVDACILPTVSTLIRFHALIAASQAPRSMLMSPAHRELAHRAAVASTVLLRNETVGDGPLLPLNADALQAVALIGRFADKVNLGDGGSSDVWADDVVTPALGLQAALGVERVKLLDGEDIDAARQLASSSDVAILIVGYSCEDEGEFLGGEGMEHLAALFPGDDDPASVERFASFKAAFPFVGIPERIADRDSTGFSPGGDRSSLRLSAQDEALIEAVVAVNPRTIVVMQGGSTVLSSPWDQGVPALIHSWYSGMEGGHALAQVIFGQADPGGRLPFSVPSAAEHLPDFDPWATEASYGRYHGWWHLEHEGHEAAYPFGFGLSYTSFNLGAAAATKTPEGWKIAVEVANVGERSGSALVQIYGRRLAGDGPARLVGFARLPLDARAHGIAEISVQHSSFAERDLEAHAMVLRSGDYELWAAQHAEELAIPITLSIP